MAETYYSGKAALYIGLAELVAGLISIGIGGFNTRDDDHFAILHFKPNGLPVWAGILFIFTGCVGLLSRKNPRNSLIQFFMGLSILSVVLGVLMFWVLLPMLIENSMETRWNLFYGSFLAIVAIIFVLNLKTIVVCFKATCLYNNGCCDKRRPREQHSRRNLRLSSLEDPCTDSRCSELSRSRSSNVRASGERRQHGRGHRESRSSPSGHMHHSERRERLQQVARVLRHEDIRPPPPPYHPSTPTSIAMKAFPALPPYSEIDRTPPPPPYTENNDT